MPRAGTASVAGRVATMLGLESRNQGSWLGMSADDWRERTGLARRTERGGLSPAVLIAGAAVIGLGYLAWTYLGPDLKRYMKIHNM
jgi:hypothetical protein